MHNELIWVIFALVNFVLFLIMYKLFGKIGIFIWVVLATILANIQVIELVDLFGLKATLGNIMYGTIFLGTDALNEIYGKKYAKKAVYMGFVVMIVTMIIMTVAMLFIPSSDDIGGYNALKTIFSFYPKVVLGSLTAFIISQSFDVYLFQKIKQKLPSNKHLWIRNNGSTMVSQLIDSAIFVPIAFFGEGLGIEVLISIFISTYLIKVMVAALDTPFIYISKKIKPLYDE